MNKRLLYANFLILFITTIFSGCGDGETTAKNGNSKTYHSDNSFSQYTDTINPDLIFEYRFDECFLESKIKDNSHNHLDATAKNTELYSTMLNGARGFSRDGFIKLPKINSNFENGLTLSAWVDFGELNDQDRHFIELSNGRNEDGSGNDFISFWQGGAKNRIRFKILNGECKTQIWANAIEDGLHHYVATYDHTSGETKIYADGIEQSTYDTSGSPLTHLNQNCLDTSVTSRDTNLLGGTVWNEYDPGFAGVLDEVKLFSRPLSLQEVNTIYNNESNGINYDGTQREAINCALETPPIIERPTFSGEFKNIKALINDSKDGFITDATYICVGDSTRADDGKHGGQYLYYQLRDTLKKYNVSSHLLAKSGYTMRDFAEDIFHPSWSDAVNLIPNNGENAIIDISLGINDAWNANIQYKIAMNIKTAIQKIRAFKPMTKFILTMPNRHFGNEENTQIMRSAYMKVAKELNIPLNNTIDSLMPTQEDTLESWYKKDGLHVHLSREGQKLMADFILKNILP